MIKVLLFDADGVLLFHTDKMFSQRLSEHLDIPLGEIQPFFEHVFTDCIIGLKDLKQEIAPYAAKWGWPGSVDELLDFWFDYEHTADQPLIEYIRQVGRSGITAFIATNNEEYRAQAMFKFLNLDGTVFQKIYAAGHLKIAKPDVEFYQKILDDMPGVHKDEILFWDDTEKNVAAAKAFGFQAELYINFEAFQARMKHYVG